jgi:hypothetical protein
MRGEDLHAAAGASEVPAASATPAAARHIARQIMIPQGFTLSIAGTIATLVGQRSDTAPVAIWLFVVGAGLSYAMISLASRAHSDVAPHGDEPIQRMRFPNLMPILVVPISTWTSALIPYTPASFACAGFLAVTTYVGSLSALPRLIAVVGRRPRHRRGKCEP